MPAHTTFLVDGQQASGTGQPFSITVQELNFQIVSISPNQGSNAGPVTINVFGSGFTPHTSVSLVAQAGTKYAASTVVFPNPAILDGPVLRPATSLVASDVRSDFAGQPACTTFWCRMALLSMKLAGRAPRDLDASRQRHIRSLWSGNDSALSARNVPDPRIQEHRRHGSTSRPWSRFWSRTPFWAVRLKVSRLPRRHTSRLQAAAVDRSS